ncbi:hypothetical protein [Bacillus massiliglaciei]|uniref:hypothetical protein n=1 Tax=Bacillus massiliglaciei TaxID=1816693 RepID=UPI000AB2C223|nr:hypothetical protein [Bacillus massiliglaciei]
MAVQLSSLHWIYAGFILLIILFMIRRLDTTIISTLGILTISIISTDSLTGSVSSIFNSFVFAITELLPTILVISIIVSLSKALNQSGVNDVMISPFTKLIKGPVLAYWVIGLLMMMISSFFWPSPAVALLGAILLPAALRAGLPAIGAAMAMNLFGHGIALSGDFIIQAAPKLTADAAGLPVSDILHASIPLVLTMGAVSTITAFVLLKRDMQRGLFTESEFQEKESAIEEKTLLKGRLRTAFAILVPAVFLGDVAAMSIWKIQGGEATALIGGTSVCLLFLLSLAAHKRKGLEKTTGYFIEGFQFGFKVFGPVIPIAAFFYLGDAGYIQITGNELPNGSQGIVNDLGVALASIVPLTKEIAAVALAGIGAITGLDGSGFSGISLAGSAARLFGTALGEGTATLTALGQIAAIWIGGGTLIPWALIPAAAICRVSPFELARRNLIPVAAGLAATTIVAMLLM